MHYFTLKNYFWQRLAHDDFCKENILICNQLSKTILIGLAYSNIYHVCSTEYVVNVLRRRSNTQCKTDKSHTGQTDLTLVIMREIVSLSAKQYNHFVLLTFVLLAYIPSRTFYTCRCIDCLCTCVFILLITLFNQGSWLCFKSQPYPGTKKKL